MSTAAKTPRDMTTEEFDAINDPASQLAAWQYISSELSRIKALEMHARVKCFGTYFPAAGEGTTNFELGNGYKLKAVKKLNYRLAANDKVDDALDAISKVGKDGEGKFIAERMVKYDPRLSLTEYKALDPTNPTHKKIKELVDGVLTITDGAPTLEIVEPKA